MFISSRDCLLMVIFIPVKTMPAVIIFRLGNGECRPLGISVLKPGTKHLSRKPFPFFLICGSKENALRPLSITLYFRTDNLSSQYRFGPPQNTFLKRMQA